MALERSADLPFEQRRRLKRLAVPLDLVFWGGLLVMLDLRVALQFGPVRSGVDVLPDVLGLGLLAAGTWMLASGGWLRGAADTLMTAAATVFAAFFFGYVASWFVPALAALQPWALAALEVVAAAAVVALCVAMRALALEFGLAPLARSWTLVAILFVLFYSLPAVVIAVSAAELPLSLLLLGILASLVPVTYLFLTMHRMKAAAEGAIGNLRGSHGMV